MVKRVRYTIKVKKTPACQQRCYLLLCYINRQKFLWLAEKRDLHVYYKSNVIEIIADFLSTSAFAHHT